MPGDHPAFAWLNYPRQPPPLKAKDAKDAQGGQGRRRTAKEAK